MRQEQLEGLVAFLAVADVQGFSAAAVRLGVTPSAISQSIRTLETRLGFCLFNRTTRGVSLTEVGERYRARVLPAVTELITASEEVGEAATRPSGLLRLNVSRSAYMIVLQPMLPRFLDAYPEIDVEVSIENQLVDVVSKGFDAGIRFGRHVDKDMIALSVGPPIQAHIIGSPDYLGVRGTPHHPQDLSGHVCIGFRHVTTGQIERWLLSRGEERLEIAPTGRFIINDSGALVQAALDGMGLAYMINGYIEPLLQQGRLVRVLADWSPMEDGFSLYYPDRNRVPPKLRAFINFLRDGVATSPGTAGWIRAAAPTPSASIVRGRVMDDDNGLGRPVLAKAILTPG